MKIFWKNYKSYIVDLSILIFSIVFTLHIENKFNSNKIVKDLYWLIVVSLIIVIISLTLLKLQIDKKEVDMEEENIKLKEENKYLENLISTFKYQISQPLEDLLHKIFKELNLDSNSRITIYTYTNGCFFSIARYSSNQSYSKFGRIAISNPDEFIMEIWKSDENCKSINVNKERNMPTKKICAFFLYEKNDEHPKKDKIGIVVFESTKNKPRNMKKDKLKKAVVEINDFIQNKMNIKQDLSFAMKEGL